MKPRIFIGSSVEGLSVAYAIQKNLMRDAEVTIWDQGAFELSKTTIEALMKIIETFDFGIFVFSKDDITKIRGTERETVRDNVIFELGLFIGHLGRERVYFVKPMNEDIYVPTDLLGITPGEYEANRADLNFEAATGSFCHQIKLQIKAVGKRSAEYSGLKISNSKMA